MLEAQVDRSWRCVFGRAPTPAEFSTARNFLEKQIATINAFPEPPAGKGDTSGSLSAEQLAMRSLCQTLLSANEFLYLE